MMNLHSVKKFVFLESLNLRTLAPNETSLIFGILCTILGFSYNLGYVTGLRGVQLVFNAT